MEYKRFGNTDLLVSPIGFGAWAIGGAAVVGDMPIGWGPASDTESIEALQYARAQGINFFDTADFYGFGHSETLIGKAFQGDQQVVLATKVGQKKTPEQTIAADYSYDYIIRACEDSLRRLQREYIDFYQFHTAQVADLEKGACIQAMEDLQKAGKIRYWGISLLTQNPFPEAQWMMERKLGQGMQLVLSVVNQKAAPLLSDLGAHEYGVIARMTLHFGLLSGKFTKETRFDPQDHRSFRLTPDFIESANEALSPFWQLAQKYEVSPATLAMAFVASHPAVSTQIPGMRTAAQVERNLKPLPALEAADLRLLAQHYEQDWKSLMGL